MRRASLLALLLFVGSLASRAQNQTTEDPLNRGVEAHKNARYDEAIDYFKKAVAADPNRLHSRLYLATAYAQQVVPTVDTPENKRLAQASISEPPPPPKR